MGCVQSQPRRPYRKPRKRAESPMHPEKTITAVPCKNTDQEAAVKQKAPQARAEAPEPARPETEVLRRATAFDKLEEEANRSPSLRDIKVVMGEHNRRLLEGFEAKEAESKAVPNLVKVDSKDLRQSKLYEKLKEYEANDERVRLEPKLETSFLQREKEKGKEKRESASLEHLPELSSVSSSTVVATM